MAKRNRKNRAQNKIVDSSLGPVAKSDPEPIAAPPAIVIRSATTAIARSPLFSAEFEKVIEIIARERVYQAMLARLERRMLMAPTQQLPAPPPLAPPTDVNDPSAQAE